MMLLLPCRSRDCGEGGVIHHACAWSRFLRGVCVTSIKHSPTHTEAQTPARTSPSRTCTSATREPLGKYCRTTSPGAHLLYPGGAQGPGAPPLLSSTMRLTSASSSRSAPSPWASAAALSLPRPPAGWKPGECGECDCELASKGAREPCARAHTQRAPSHPYPPHTDAHLCISSGPTPAPAKVPAPAGPASSGCASLPPRCAHANRGSV